MSTLFGNSLIGGTPGAIGSSTTILAWYFQGGPISGTISSVNIYGSAGTATAIQLAVYNSSGTLICSSSALTVSSTIKWWTASVSGTLNDPSGNYYICLEANGTWNAYSGGSSGSYNNYTSATYGTWPSSVTFSNVSSNVYSVYFTYSGTTLNLDGSSTANNSGLNISTSLTVANSYDLIIACIAVGNGNNTITMGGGLTWTYYNSESAGSVCTIIIYYATSTSALNSQSITCTLNGAAQEPATMTVFGVSGVNLSKIFDSGEEANSKTGSSTSTISATMAAFSNPNDIYIQATALNNTSGGWTSGTIGGNTTTPIQSGSTSYTGVQYYVSSTELDLTTAVANWTTGRPAATIIFAIEASSGGHLLSLLGVGS